MILDLLLGAAETHADRVAIEPAAGAPITYRALLDRARQFAAMVQPGDIVELPARRTPEFLVGCLGAWLAGAAWTPLDPDEPAERRARVQARLAAARGTANLAYAIATSGSSGEPKVVLVSHRGLPGLVRAQVAAFALDPGARSLWLHAPVFDASISDWATAFASGATLVIPASGDVRGELVRRAITHVDLPTALLGELADPPAALRVVVLGGAPCPPERVAALAARLRVVVVYGPTEATVCSSLAVVDPRRWSRPLIGDPIAGITYRVESGELWIAGDGLAIGYAGDPVETAARFVVAGDPVETAARFSDAGDPVETAARFGVAGDPVETAARLVVAGDTRPYPTGDRIEPTADGTRHYRTGDRSEPTADGTRHYRTGDRSEPTADGTRYYRTGDRVEPTADGLAFLGRIDRQVKLAGGRVELDEVEAALRRCPGVADAAACVRRARRLGRERLYGFVEGEAIDVAAVRAQLRAELPAWMQPAQIVVGPLPRTPTAKVAHAALALPRPRTPVVLPPRAARGESEQAMLALPPRTALGDDPLAAELAALWCDALGITEVHAADHFADCGGDSLAALSLRAAGSARGIAIDPSGNPTFDVLVARVRGTARELLAVRDCEARGLAAANVILGTVWGGMASSSDVAVESAVRSARGADAQRGDGRGGDARGGDARGDDARGGRVRGGGGRAGDAVLVTGATGLLGTHVLAAWRARDRRPLIALVRGTDEVAARRRCTQPGVEVVCGDIAAPRFGLAEAAWEWLVARVGSVVHCAAVIRLGEGWEGHAAVNVGGTVEVARFVAASGARWHHVSTLSVFVGTDGRRARYGEADVPAADARVFGGYAATKIAAEAIARAAPATTVLRLGLLTSARPRATDQLAMTIRGLVKLGAVPAGCGALCFDVTPVEYAAAAVVELALHAEADGAVRSGAADRGGGARSDAAVRGDAPPRGARSVGRPAIHHVASATGATFGALVAAIGRDLAVLPLDAWADRARAGFADPDVAMAYLALARRGHAFDLFLAADFAVERTARLLAGRGVVAPSIELGSIARGALA